MCWFVWYNFFLVNPPIFQIATFSPVSSLSKDLITSIVTQNELLWINTLPNEKFLDYFKLKAYADENTNAPTMAIFLKTVTLIFDLDS